MQVSRLIACRSDWLNIYSFVRRLPFPSRKAFVHFSKLQFSLDFDQASKEFDELTTERHKLAWKQLELKNQQTEAALEQTNYDRPQQDIAITQEALATNQKSTAAAQWLVSNKQQRRLPKMVFFGYRQLYLTFHFPEVDLRRRQSLVQMVEKVMEQYDAHWTFSRFLEDQDRELGVQDMKLVEQQRALTALTTTSLPFVGAVSGRKKRSLVDSHDQELPDAAQKRSRGERPSTVALSSASSSAPRSSAGKVSTAAHNSSSSSSSTAPAGLECQYSGCCNAVQKLHCKSCSLYGLVKHFCVAHQPHGKHAKNLAAQYSDGQFLMECPILLEMFAASQLNEESVTNLVVPKVREILAPLCGQSINGTESASELFIPEYFLTGHHGKTRLAYLHEVLAEVAEKW